MTSKFYVLADVPDSYTTKKGTAVKTQLLTLVDRSSPDDCRLTQTLDYQMNPEEKERYAGSLADKEIEVAVRELMVFGGRLRARGKIVSNGQVKPAGK